MFKEPQKGYKVQRVNNKGKKGETEESSMGLADMMKEDEKGYKAQRIAKKSGKKSPKGKSPYNKFVAEQSPLVRKENPGMKQPQVMKEIAKRWNAQK